MSMVPRGAYVAEPKPPPGMSSSSTLWTHGVPKTAKTFTVMQSARIPDKYMIAILRACDDDPQFLGDIEAADLVDTTDGTGIKIPSAAAKGLVRLLKEHLAKPVPPPPEDLVHHGLRALPPPIPFGTSPLSSVQSTERVKPSATIELRPPYDAFTPGRSLAPPAQPAYGGVRPPGARAATVVKAGAKKPRIESSVPPQGVFAEPATPSNAEASDNSWGSQYGGQDDDLRDVDLDAMPRTPTRRSPSEYESARPGVVQVSAMISRARAHLATVQQAEEEPSYESYEEDEVDTTSGALGAMAKSRPKPPSASTTGAQRQDKVEEFIAQVAQGLPGPERAECEELFQRITGSYGVQVQTEAVEAIGLLPCYNPTRGAGNPREWNSSHHSTPVNKKVKRVIIDKIGKRLSDAGDACWIYHLASVVDVPYII